MALKNWPLSLNNSMVKIKIPLSEPYRRKERNWVFKMPE
jgi:hypothetical protein